MGILDRFSDIMASNVNALLDKMENPEKMIDQTIRNLKEELAEVKRDTAAVVAEETRTKRMLEENKKNVDEFFKIAQKALAAGVEDDARKALVEKQKFESREAGLSATYEVAKGNADKMRALHDKLVKDIQSLEARKDGLKAKNSVAKTQERLNKINSGVYDDASGAFNRMEEKINKRFDTAMAGAALNEEMKSDADLLAEKYAGPAQSAVDDELAALKASMNLPNSN